jgi:hypothetical protein
MQDGVGEPAAVRRVKRALAGRHLEQHHSERVDVGSRVDSFTAHLLRGHVRQRPDELAGDVCRRLVDARS